MLWLNPCWYITTARSELVKSVLPWQFPSQQADYVMCCLCHALICHCHMKDLRNGSCRFMNNILSCNHIHTLSEKNMAGSSINIVICWFSTVNHQAVYKLHGLGSLASQLSRNHNFTALGTTFHDKTQHTVACPGITYHSSY